jgi:hypothetical protein
MAKRRALRYCIAGLAFASVAQAALSQTTFSVSNVHATTVESSFSPTRAVVRIDTDIDVSSNTVACPAGTELEYFPTGADEPSLIANISGIISTFLTALAGNIPLGLSGSITSTTVNGTTTYTCTVQRAILQ